MTEENKVILDTDKLPNFADTFIDINTYKRLEQENKDFEILAKSLYKRIEEPEKENEALAFRERLYKADYEASEQENKKLSFAIEKCLENAGIECDDEEQALRSLPMLGNAHYKVLVEKEELEQENKELKEENIKVKKEFNNLIAEIISDIEYTGEITCNGESPKEHLKKCQKALKALEEIKVIADDTFHCCDDDCGNARKIKLILNKINEVLNDN